MFHRTFDPATVTLDDTITVERTDDATVLNVPRHLADFGRDTRPRSLGEQLRQLTRTWLDVGN